MDSFITKIFHSKTDDLVHLQFEKFSRGEYRDKCLIKASNKKGFYSIATTAEFANDLVRTMAEKLGDKKAKVTGVIVSTRDLTGLLEYDSKKQFMGIKQYGINKELSGKDLVSLMDKFPRAFFGLSFSVDGSELKTKAKAPKSAKPSTSDKPPVPEFCKLKTTDTHLVKTLIFETTDFVTYEANHTLKITDIELPKGVSDPIKMREMAIRKGTIVRKTIVDGKEKILEHPFTA